MMPSVNANLIIALAIGALISSGLLVLEPLTDYAFLSLEWPGVTAAYFFWERSEAAPSQGSLFPGS